MASKVQGFPTNITFISMNILKACFYTCNHKISCVIVFFSHNIPWNCLTEITLQSNIEPGTHDYWVVWTVCKGSFVNKQGRRSFIGPYSHSYLTFLNTKKMLEGIPNTFSAGIWVRESNDWRSLWGFILLKTFIEGYELCFIVFMRIRRVRHKTQMVGSCFRMRL